MENTDAPPAPSASTTGAAPGRAKRDRKTAQAFAPDDFSAIKNRVTITEGRGTQLSDIPSVQESIHAFSRNSEEMARAHSLVFGGRAARKFLKEDLLAFSGFLPPKAAGQSKEDLEEMEEEVETKMSEKAFKLTIPELKMLCDFFTIDRSAHDGETITKDVLVDRLLDFLGAPANKLTKDGVAAAKKRKKQAEESPKKTKKTKQQKEEEEEEEDAVETVGSDGLPTDKALRKWVRAYIVCFNLEKATTKHALETASDKFGVDLSAKKALLKQMLTEEM